MEGIPLTATEAERPKADRTFPCTSLLLSIAFKELPTDEYAWVPLATTVCHWWITGLRSYCVQHPTYPPPPSLSSHSWAWVAPLATRSLFQLAVQLHLFLTAAWCGTAWKHSFGAWLMDPMAPSVPRSGGPGSCWIPSGERSLLTPCYLMTYSKHHLCFLQGQQDKCSGSGLSPRKDTSHLLLTSNEPSRDPSILFLSLYFTL